MTNATLYLVTVHVQFPAWDERDGFDYEIRASDRATAIKYARARFREDGHGDGKGRVTFKAKPAEVAQ